MMTWLRLAPLLALVGCQSNTIDLEDGDGTGSAMDTGPGQSTAMVTTAGPTTNVDDSSADAEVDEGSFEDMAVPTDVGLPPEGLVMLLAIDTTVAPGLPLQAVVWLEPNIGTVDLALQWLSLDPGSTTEPRELVGEPIVYPMVPLDGEDGFTWEAGELLIPGEANPITGSDLVIVAELQVVADGSPYCGRVSGEVVSPLQVPLEGSTHAMTAIESPDELPLEFPVTCP